MLRLSDIKASDEELRGYYAELRAQHLSPLWLGDRITSEPRSKAIPYVWHWRDLRPQAMRAAQLVGTEQAERRVLRLTNPELPGPSASTTLSANIQIVMPGEMARAHRHTAAALRLIIEGQGGYTVVNGHRIPMRPGDLVLTPNWTWHDHANDTAAPMIWLDGLDSPMVRMLEAGFYEEYHAAAQAVRADAAPQWHYPISDARAALERLAAGRANDAAEDVALEYTNPRTGGPTMPTIACHLQRLRPGEHTRARRRVCCANYHVIEGAGYSVVGGRRLDWEDKDVFTVPTWSFYEHVNAGDRPAFLFSFTDAPVLRALDLYREEAAAR